MQQYLYQEKRWDRESGTVEWQTTTLTLAELNALKTALQAKVAQLNKIIADCQALG